MLQHIPTDLPLIAITSYQDSSSCPLFAQRPPSKCILLPAPIPCSEAEVFGVPAPTTSTTTSLALTDALTLAVARRLHPDPCVVFRVHHPGGAIGASMAKAGRRLVGDIAFEVHGIPVVAPRNVQEGCTVLDAILTAAKSVSGWVRPTPETVISPRQVQRIGHEVDVSQPLRLLGDGVLVEQGDWISIEATSTVQEAREWIRRILRQTERAKTFLKRGTVLGIVDGQRCKTGVVEIEEIIDEEELKE